MSLADRGGEATPARKKRPGNTLMTRRVIIPSFISIVFALLIHSAEPAAEALILSQIEPNLLTSKPIEPLRHQARADTALMLRIQKTGIFQTFLDECSLNVEMAGR